MARRSAAPAPPNYRPQDTAGECCATCHMFDDGVCWGYGNTPVSPDHVCDSWAAEPNDTNSALGGQLMDTHEQRQAADEPQVGVKDPQAQVDGAHARRGGGARGEARALREEMRGVREERRVAISQFQIREVPNGSGGSNLRFEGYASVTCASMDDLTHTYEMEDWLGPYQEGVVRGAFTKTLAEGADVSFLVNHGGVTMARTKPNTLTLFEDLVGIHVDAILNPSRSDVQILQAAVADGAIDEMSFAFRVVRQTWSWAEDNGEIDRRWLQEVNLDKGDVSAVNYGANPHTGGLVSMRSAMGALLSGRGLSYEAFAQALRELRAGQTISQATRDVLQPILDHLASIDNMVDADQGDLAQLLGVANPDDDDDGEDGDGMDESLAAAPVIPLLLPDYGAEARQKLARMRGRS